MTRREFAGALAAGATAFGASQAERPNILFILADDLGYGDLGCYGQEQIKTPNLDRLATEGIRFTQAYAGSTVCAPSRCCLMTGKHTGHATVRGNKIPELGLSLDESTVAEVLKRAGYRTALFGKWGLGGYDMDSHPNDRGFDEFFGYLNQLHAHKAFPDYLWDNKTEHFLKENWFFEQKVFANDLFTDKTIDFLERTTQPFFVYLNYTVPHANNELGRVRANGMEAPGYGIYEKEPWPDVEKTFASAITHMDASVGRIVSKLDDKLLANNTLVIFSSDNGPHREGGHDPGFFRSSGPLRGTKRDLYEGGIRVPVIARWKSRIAPAQTSDYQCAFWDFLPTAADLAAVRPPAGIDGISLVPVLSGKPAPDRDHLYWEFFEGGFQQALRQGDWKLVRQAPDLETRLFNIKEDIGEWRDVSAQNRDVVAALEKYFQTARTDHPKFPTDRKVESVPF